MIDKITAIHNIGRYRNYNRTADDISFKKYTFIYGKNTRGKTTLTAILKSLGNQNSDIIIGRKSFGTTGEQLITLKLSGGSTVLFNNTARDTHIKTKVFDNQYIAENIYSDDYMDEEKQQKIATIILGAEWRRLEQAYDTTKRSLDENTQAKSALTREYSQDLGNTIFEFDQFRDLTIDPEIDSKIKSCQDKLESFRNQANISTSLDSIGKEISQIQIQVDRKIIEQSLDIPHQLIEAHIKAHFEHTEGALNFLGEGTGFLKTSDDVPSCVYCGQFLESDESIQLIDAYKKLFSEQYKVLTKSIKDSLLFLRGRNIEKTLLQHEAQLLKRGVKMNIASLIELVTEYKTKIIEELEKKENDLNHKIDFSGYDVLVKSFGEFSEQFLLPLQKEYGKSIDNEEKNKLEAELKKLILIQTRFTERWIEKCDQYNALEQHGKNVLKPAEVDAFEQKRLYAEQIFSSYETSINTILDALQANFQLCNFQVPQNRRDPIRLFGIRFGSDIVPIDGEEVEPHFKNTLSDSDKRLLAFAFFVVDIQNTDNIEDYIIVLDDPMSSLDTERKKMTVQVLRDKLQNTIGQEPQQIIILSHEDNFYKMLYKSFVSPNRTFLKVDYISSDATSKILPCNIEEEFLKTSHIKALEKFHKYESGEIDGCDLGQVRICLEHIIKVKYYPLIDITSLNSGAVVGRYLTNHCDAVKSQKINDLFASLPHHDQADTAVSLEELEENEKKDIITKFLGLIKDI